MRSKYGWVGWKEKERNGTTWGEEVDRIIIRNSRLLQRSRLGVMVLKIVLSHEIQSCWKRAS